MPQGHPTSPEVVKAIKDLSEKLQREYGSDYSFCIYGKGTCLAADTFDMGVVQPTARSVQNEPQVQHHEVDPLGLDDLPPGVGRY